MKKECANMAFIYRITNLVNGKVYVGKTSSTIEERFKVHIRDSKKRKEEKRPLYDAFNKYGIENFKIEEIEQVVNDEIASQREVYWINKLRTYIGFDDCKGYNATLGGDSRRLYNYKEIADYYSKIQNEKETAEYFHCDVSVVKQACSEYDVKIKSGAEISKEKNGKRVARLDKDTLEVLEIYDSISDAFKSLNKTKNGALGKACKEDKICLGYRWKFVV